MLASLRHPALALAANCILILSTTPQQSTTSADTSAPQQSDKAQKQHKKNARNELGHQYGDWLNNEVP